MKQRCRNLTIVAGYIFPNEKARKSKNKHAEKNKKTGFMLYYVVFFYSYQY